MRSTTVAQISQIQMGFSGALQRYTICPCFFFYKQLSHFLLSLFSVKLYHKVDSEGNHLRGNFGYCGPECSEDDDDEEFDKEVFYCD